MQPPLQEFLSLINYRKMLSQQKTKSKIADQTSEDSETLIEILQTILSRFQAHQIVVGSEFILTQKVIDDSSGEISSIKSLKAFKREVDIHLSSFKQLLTKQLANSLDQIFNEVFDDDLDETSKHHGINCLIIFYSLLRIQAISDEDCNKVLKWIFDITSINSMELSMELCNVVASIKKRIIRLGFAVLRRINNESQAGCGKESEDEEEFKVAVTLLISQKQKEISGLKYEICRVCEKYIPLTSIVAHINLCEKVHQIQYLQSKLQDKGNKLIGIICQLEDNSEEKYNLRIFFNRVYSTIGDVFVTFALKKQLKEITRVIEQYKGIYQSQIYLEVIELLENYKVSLEMEADFGDNLSDKDSKNKKSRNRISISIKKMGSNTSLIPSFRTVEQEEVVSQSSSAQQIASEKTINTDTEAMIRHHSLKLEDFEILASIGKGSYSQVFLVRKRNTKDLFAMKVIEIEHLNKDRIHAFKQQQKIYKSITGGFNVKLYYSFGKANLYFLILDYGCGGSFKQLLEKQVYLEENYAKVYIANLILAVNSIHQMGIVHRDLKPDNIVINELGQLILTDFNLSKLMIDRDNQKSHSFFGTPDYIAPQVLKGEHTNHMIDYFSVGVIAYEMVIGVTPFTGDSPQQVFQNILEGKIQWPDIGTGEGEITKECQDLIQALLHPDPSKRLGANGLSQLQSHPFFQGVNWSNISQCQFFFVPPKSPHHKENHQLSMYIKKKFKDQSEKVIPGDVIVRYDILKSITNKNVRSHRSSRFKLEKELEALRLLPSAQNVKLKKHNSQYNFNSAFEDSLGISCRDLYEEMENSKAGQ